MTNSFDCLGGEFVQQHFRRYHRRGIDFFVLKDVGTVVKLSRIVPARKVPMEIQRQAALLHRKHHDPHQLKPLQWRQYLTLYECVQLAKGHEGMVVKISLPKKTGKTQRYLSVKRFKDSREIRCRLEDIANPRYCASPRLIIPAEKD